MPWYCGLKSQPPFFGWIPNKNKEEVEQVLNIKEFNCFISSVKVKELSSNFSKVSIVIQMYMD